MENTDNKKYRQKRINELKESMTGKQFKFAEEYLIDLNATQAAIRANYSKKTAGAIGFENLKKPEIREYINLRLDDYDITHSELLKLMSSVARSSLNEYIVVKKIERIRDVKKPLKLKIENLLVQIQKKTMYMERANLSDEARSSIQMEIDHLHNDIIKCEIDLEIDPDATFDVSERYEEDVADIDLIALARDKENGKIKGLSFTQYGPKIEMSDSDSMIKLLAQVKGMITNKIDAEISNQNINVDVSPEEAAEIWKELKKDF